MLLQLQRITRSSDSTIGKLFVDGEFMCFTLEPGLSSPKGPIPRGSYIVKLEHSPHFQRITPHLHNIPGFTFVEIHPGNTAADTHGCILVGEVHGLNAVYQSRAAFKELMTHLTARPDHITIQIG